MNFIIKPSLGMAMVHAAAASRKAGVRLAGVMWLTGVIGHETPIGKKDV
jgi:hypothetical protein